MREQEIIIGEKRITRIYLVTNCYGDPNKVYIGKTNNRIGRKTRHIKTYGEYITYDYIDEIQSINKKDWKIIEGFWIQYFKFLGFDVQNINKYGGGGPSFYSEEQKNKMRKPKNHGEKVSKSLKGRKNYWVVKGKKGRLKTPIIQFDLKNNFVKEWSSQKQAATELNLDLGTLTACLKGRQKTCGRFIWKYNPINTNNLKSLL